MSERRRHPIGTGTYEVWRLDAPEKRVRVPGHTAFEAWNRAAAELECAGFGECETELVADTWDGPLPDAAPAPAARKRRAKAKAA